MKGHVFNKTKFFRWIAFAVYEGVIIYTCANLIQQDYTQDEINGTLNGFYMLGL